MKPSFDSPTNPETQHASFDLEPITPLTVRDLPPLLSLEQMLRRNRQLRKWFPDGIRPAEERWADKTLDEFSIQ